MNPAPPEPDSGHRPPLTIEWDVVARSQQVLLRLHLRVSDSGVGEPTTAQTVATGRTRELRPYRRLDRRLRAGRGAAFHLESSLLNTAYTPLDAERIRSWLEAALAYLNRSLRGKAGSTTPPPRRFQIVVDPDQLNRSSLFELKSRLIVKNPLDGLEDGTCSIPIIPRISSEPPRRARSLTRFASRFEAALRTEGADVKLLVEPGAAGSDPLALWAARVPTGAFGVRLLDQARPDLLAVRPLCNRLESRYGVTVRRYATGEGMIAPEDEENRDFAGVSCDDWLRGLAQLVDELGSSSSEASIRFLSTLGKSDYAGRLGALRTELADALTELLVPTFAADDKSIAKRDDPAREAFRKRLVGGLGNAFATMAVVKLRTAVEGGRASAGSPPVELFGMVTSDGPLAPADGGCEATATLLLDGASSAGAASLSFTVPATFDRWPEGSGDRLLPLSLDFRCGLPGGDLVATADSPSRRLVPILPDQPEAARTGFSLGRVVIPRILRRLPSPPVAVGHSGESARDPSLEGLAAATAWRYSVQYEQAGHCVQDRLLLRVDFNRVGRPGESAGLHDATEADHSPRTPPCAGQSLIFGHSDPFPALARFAFVMPQVRADLERHLPLLVEPGSAPDRQIVRNATCALDTFLTLAEDVRASLTPVPWAVTDQPMHLSVGGTASDPVEYMVEELSREVEQPEGAVRALLVVIRCPAQPTGSSHGTLAPIVRIPGWVEHPVGGVIEEGFAYVYTDPATGEHLEESRGRSIAGREFVLPRLDALSIMSASCSLRLVRNEALDPARPISASLIYSTESVSLAVAVVPRLHSDRTLDIAKIGDAPGPRSLQDHLGSLFAALFATDDSPTRIVQLTCLFAPARPSSGSPLIPVLHLPPTMVDAHLVPVFAGPDLAGAGDASATLPRQLAAYIAGWLEQSGADPGRGELQFDLTVFAPLDDPPLPLVRIERLVLAGDDIVFGDPV